MHRPIEEKRAEQLLHRECPHMFRADGAKPEGGWRIGWKDTLSLMALARAESEEERPFWLWFAALQFCAEHECEESQAFPCSETDKCVTEYCPPCAAKTFLARMPNNPWSQGQDGEQ
jgi:hypothetical protein